MQSFNSRKTLLSSNPSLYISKTRLSIRQLPIFCTDRVLKRLAIYASRQFDKEVKAGDREGLDDDEKRDGTLSAAVEKQQGKEKKKGKAERDTIVIQAKVVRANDRVDPLTGLGKSKGYGFLELRSHQDALKVLRWANNNPEVETLMRDWFAGEVKDLTERTKKAVDEARLKELTGGSTLVEEEKKKKPRKGKQRKIEESEDDELPKAAPSKITPPGEEDLQELEARLGRLRDKERELQGQIDHGKGVEMKKTLIVEFSIENVQVRLILPFRLVVNFFLTPFLPLCPSPGCSEANQPNSSGASPQARSRRRGRRTPVWRQAVQGQATSDAGRSGRGEAGTCADTRRGSGKEAARSHGRSQTGGQEGQELDSLSDTHVLDLIFAIGLDG